MEYGLVTSPTLCAWITHFASWILITLPLVSVFAGTVLNSTYSPHVAHQNTLEIR